MKTEFCYDYFMIMVFFLIAIGEFRFKIAILNNIKKKQLVTSHRYSSRAVLRSKLAKIDQKLH